MNHRLSPRLNRSWTEAGTGSGAAARRDVGASMPPMNRGSMVARPWRGVIGGLIVGWIALMDRLAGRPAVPDTDSPAPPMPADAGATAAWKRSAVRRRRALLALVALSVVGATAMLDQVLPTYSSDALRTAQIALFSVLFGWVSAGFYTAMMGFWVQWRGGI